MQHLITPSAGSILSYTLSSAYLSAKAFAVNRIKYGHDFRETMAELEKSRKCSPSDLEALREEKLRALLKHAYLNVPYYRDQFRRLRLTPEDFRTAKDLKKLPILTKDDLRSQPDAFVARDFPKAALASGWTTGSTGTPINALRDRRSIVFESAAIWRQRHLAGVSLHDRRAAVWGTIWNNTIVPSAQHRPPYWRHNAADRQLLLSYYHISKETFPLYLERLANFRPAFIEGFPSTILLLAEFLNKLGSAIPMKAVFTSSERLYDVHRELIEKSFQAKVFDLYGQSERVVMATECEIHKGLHVNPEYGIMEILENGEDARPGESGEIVGTGLNNYGMPLIRYRTGDVATLAEGPCPCGWETPLLHEIEGRGADLILTPEGRIVPGNGLMMALHGIRNVSRTQVVQDSRDHLTVRVVAEDRRADIDGPAIIRNLHACVGEAMHIDVESVEAIADPSHTKQRWVVSNIPNMFTGESVSRH